MSEKQLSENQTIAVYAMPPLWVKLWENEAENADGTKRTYRTVSIVKSFHNKKTNLIEFDNLSLYPSQIGCLIKLLERMQDTALGIETAATVRES